MALLKDFKSKSFPEQIGILAQIGKQNEIQYLPELFSLYQDLTDDKTVDAMIEHTLRDVLLANEAETVEKIITGTVKEKRLCLQVAGKRKFSSAVPAITKLVKMEPEVSVLTEAFIAMSEIKAPEFLELFRKHLHHSNEIISAICIEMMGSYHDETSITDLEEIIDEAESDELYMSCSVATADAIESIAQLDTQESDRFLVSKIHHRNPTARRIIQEELVRKGEKVLPLLEDVFSNTNPNPKIMAAGIIGRIGNKKGGDILVNVLDKGLANHTNVRAAIYEAFGLIDNLKGLVCLADALDEERFQVLMTVISSLDHHVKPGVIVKIKDLLMKKDEQSENLLHAIIDSRALELFEHLYRFEEIRDSLIDTILHSNDPEILDVFAKRLQSIPDDHAKADYEKLTNQQTETIQRRILAVDDSKPMRLFYRGILTKMNIDTITAENGKIALDIIEGGDTFDLIITDLNMPVMDGIEFVSKVRARPDLKTTPIIMCTTESDQSQVEMAEKKGVSAFVTKPVTRNQLAEKVENFFG